MSSKIISLILTWILIASPLITSAEYGIYYWTNASYAKKTIKTFDTIIIQPYNLNLYKNYTGKKICYLTVGEFDWTADELWNLWLSGAVVGFNSDWNSFIMNMSNLKRQDYLIKEELKLKNMWCNGLFLDTIWQDWQETGWIEIVKKIRENWKDAYIIPNNAHFIRNDILNYVNAFMFENFWDMNIKDNSEDAKWLLVQMQEYQNLTKWTNKKLYAISYGNPFVSKNKKWWEKIKNLSIKYWFEQIFTNLHLTNIYWYLNKKTNKINKVAWVK